VDISVLSGIGTGRAKQLLEIGIRTVADLLRFLPRDYEDRSVITPINELIPGAVYTVRATIAAEGENVNFNKLVITKIQIEGNLQLVWFGQPYLKRAFKKHEEYLFTGRVTESYGRLQMESPEYEKAADINLSAGRIVPVYTLPKGISQKMFRKWVKAALDVGLKEIEEHLQEAIQNIHFPESNEHFYNARRRLVFEELFLMQLALLHIKGARQPGIIIGEIELKPFLNKLPFTLTDAQLSTLDDIKADLQKGQRMNRLVQGDVGSGKTAVAAAAAYLVINAGYQVAIMAPTEVLARQHYKQLSNLFDDCILLTGSLKAKEKREAHEAIQNGKARMIIGTHALIQEGVAYHNLGLVITDEQHRFGVNQRAALSEKGFFATLPHTLIMTATPIPRTLGLILYGDMDISTINALPPGRQSIKTYRVNSAYKKRLVTFMAKQVAEGRQVYIICPAIEESEADIYDVNTYTERLQKALPDIPIACLHGRLKDKESVMAAFAKNEFPIIVSTTVIEVGVDVPNATLIIIENAERFGLSQLHQLRGRVGRGQHQSYCVLVTDSKAEHTLERMQAMEKSNDGFELSELDLKLRGPGDFFGVEQHGLPAFAIANLYRDMDILKEAQQAALNMYESGANVDHLVGKIIKGMVTM